MSRVEQDHRGIKRSCAAMTGFKSFHSVAIALSGIELAHRLRTRQFSLGPAVSGGRRRWSSFATGRSPGFIYGAGAGFARPGRRQCARTPSGRRPALARRWRVLLYEFLPLQLGPEIRGGGRLHRGYIGEDLLFIARTDDQGCRDVRGCGET